MVCNTLLEALESVVNSGVTVKSGVTSAPSAIESSQEYRRAIENAYGLSAKRSVASYGSTQQTRGQGGQRITWSVPSPSE